MAVRVVSVEDVSVLLGHSSVQTTGRYYAPSNRSLRDRLARILWDAHKQGPAAGGAVSGSRPGTGPGMQRQSRPRRPDSVPARKPMIRVHVLALRSSPLCPGI